MEHIGRKLGAGLDKDGIEKHITWNETLRMRININVMAPLRRVLKLILETGDEAFVRSHTKGYQTVVISVESWRHISRFCRRHFEKGFTDPRVDAAFGPWLSENRVSRSYQLFPINAQPTVVHSFRSSLSLSPINDQPTWRGWKGSRIFSDFGNYDDNRCNPL